MVLEDPLDQAVVGPEDPLAPSNMAVEATEATAQMVEQGAQMDKTAKIIRAKTQTAQMARITTTLLSTARATQALTVAKLALSKAMKVTAQTA